MFALASKKNGMAQLIKRVVSKTVDELGEDECAEHAEIEQLEKVRGQLMYRFYLGRANAVSCQTRAALISSNLRS